MAAIAKMVASTIRNQLELIKINEDYEKLLKPQIGKTTKDFIDAICVYITNQRLQKCKPAKETSSKSAVVKNTEDLLRSYFEHNSKIDMLAYKPTYSVDKMLGGRKLTINELIIMGGGLTDNITGIIGSGAGGLGSGAGGLGSAAGGLGSGAGGLGSAAIPDNIIDSTDVSALITSTKAKDVMDFYTTEIISKLQCNDDMHKYIDEHIIQPVFAVASKHITEVGSHHLTDLAKTTTEFHLKKCVLLIKGQLDTFGAILNIVSIQPTDNTIPNIIIPQYIHLLFELFVYSEYGLIVDMPIGINGDGIQAYIRKLNPFNVQIDNYIKDDKYPDGIMSMNGLKLPDSWNTNKDDEADKIKMITKELVIAEFKKLFKPVVAKAKGGGRKSRTKKHRTRYLPVAKHCSRRKRQ